MVSFIGLSLVFLPFLSYACMRAYIRIHMQTKTSVYLHRCRYASEYTVRDQFCTILDISIPAQFEIHAYGIRSHAYEMSIFLSLIRDNPDGIIYVLIKNV